MEEHVGVLDRTQLSAWLGQIKLGKLLVGRPSLYIFNTAGLLMSEIAFEIIINAF